jgi:heme/copper-type cytochrome/quinol oxidase subunit 2
MLDFTEGWAWFVAGIGITLLVFLFLLLMVAFARRSEQRIQSRKP